MFTNDFVSPMIHALTRLIKSPEYASLGELYDAEERLLMKELIACPEEKDLRVIQGKAKMLKRLRNLPEETVDRYINEKKRETK